ncbi:MAG: hypothetical protein MJ252_05480 [archaeon]|nr:hypothetical protein [archaeon]
MILADLFKSSNKMNFYDSIDCNAVDKNSLLIPHLIYNKEEKKDRIIQLLEKTYDKLKVSNKFNNSQSNIYPLYNFYIFNKEESLKNTLGASKAKGSFVCKYYAVFPNVNFEIKQIKNIPFSNTNLNRYLVRKEKEEITGSPSEYKDGFFTMSQNHRLIALKNDIMEKGGIKGSQTLKQILFGIWLNFTDINISHRKIDITDFLNKNKKILYQKCFDFIQLSSKAESIFSPSPDQSIFLMVLFFKEMQCHFEVKLIPNEEDKIQNYEEILNTEGGEIFSKFGPNWLISKSKINLSSHQGINIDLENLINDSKVYNLSDYYEKKTGINKSNILTKSTNTNRNAGEKNSMNFNFQDNLLDIFDTSDLELSNTNDDICNYPLVRNQKEDIKEISQIPSLISPTKNFFEEGNNLNNLSKRNFNESSSTPKKSLQDASSNSVTTKVSNITNTSTPENNLKEMILEQGKILSELQNQVNNLEINIKNVLDELMKQKDISEEEEEEEEEIEEIEGNEEEEEQPFTIRNIKIEEDIKKDNKSLEEIHNMRNIVREEKKKIEGNIDSFISNEKEKEKDISDPSFELSQTKIQENKRKPSNDQSVLVPKIIYQESLLNHTEDSFL